tara:strand:- start:312 stop:731 length:420 start_codon:yes stop_codon:yes gene_type:complete
MTSQQIKEYIDDRSGLDIATMCRKSEFIKYRSMYSFLCHRYAEDGHSFSRIARVIKKDDNSIRHSIKTFESFMLTDIHFRSDFNSIKDHVVNNTSKKTHDSLDSLEMINFEILKANLIRKKLNHRDLDKYIALKTKLNK